jgi:uncharacterized protein DUF222
MGNLTLAIDELLAGNVRDLPDATLVEEIEAINRAINRLHAAYHERVEVLDRRGAMAAEHGSTAAWLRSTLRRSPIVASREVHLARDLTDVMPCVARALADGDISASHAQVLASLRKALTDEQLRSADPHLAAAALTSTPQELREFVTAVRHSYAPQRVAKDEKEAYDERRLHASKTLYGTGVGNWTADPVSHETVTTAIHAASAPIDGDDRTPAQRRFDGLLAVCEIALRSGLLPETGGVKPHVSVIVDLATLQGRAGATTAILGYGAAVSGAAARRLACDADVSRIISGPSSEILDAGRATRTFTAAQRRAIVVRDRHCIWPGCDRPPVWCDAHHVVHWVDGGTTSVDNGVLLCGRHHDRVHHDQLAVVVRSDGRRSVDVRRHSARDRPVRPAADNSQQRAGP